MARGDDREIVAARREDATPEGAAVGEEAHAKQPRSGANAGELPE